MSYRSVALDIHCSQTIDSVAGVFQSTHALSVPQIAALELHSMCVYTRTHTLEGCLSEYDG
jgi:hypothetical protein